VPGADAAGVAPVTVGHAAAAPHQFLALPQRQAGVQLHEAGHRLSADGTVGVVEPLNPGRRSAHSVEVAAPPAPPRPAPGALLRGTARADPRAGGPPATTRTAPLPRCYRGPACFRP